MRTVADLLGSQATWLSSPGEHDGIVVSSRVRLARNVRGQHFRRQLGREEQAQLVQTLMDTAASALPWDGLSCTLDQLSATERQALFERRLISRELANSGKPAGVIVSEDERVSIMVNEEDHVRLQAMASDLAVDEVLRQAVAVDRRLEEVLPWAVHPRFGYLTSCPTNVGTGLRIGVMLHLPALAETKELARALRGIGKLHLTVRGLFGEGSEAAGQYYQVSTQRTLGSTEEEMAATLGECVTQLIAYERLARAALLERRRLQTEDKVFRAWGTLTQARRLSSDELTEQLSWVRFGMATGVLDYQGWDIVDRVFLRTQAAHLQLEHPDAADAEIRDELRAALVRGWLVGGGR